MCGLLLSLWNAQDRVLVGLNVFCRFGLPSALESFLLRSVEVCTPPVLSQPVSLLHAEDSTTRVGNLPLACQLVIGSCRKNPDRDVTHVTCFVRRIPQQMLPLAMSLAATLLMPCPHVQECYTVSRTSRLPVC